MIIIYRRAVRSAALDNLYAGSMDNIPNIFLYADFKLIQQDITLLDTTSIRDSFDGLAFSQ